MYKGSLVNTQLYRSDQSMTKAANQSPKPNKNKSAMGMEVLSRRSPSSDLNPNAPIFVPLAYRTVEDFSEQWWDLVKSSPWFRDYWLQERYQQEEFLQEQIEAEFDFEDFIEDAFFVDPQQKEEEKKGEKGERMDVVKFGVEKWNGRGWEGPPKYATKAPKIVNLKRVSPRVIQQPR